MMIDYSWVPWLRELVGKIADNDEGYLVEKAKAVKWKQGEDNAPAALLLYGDRGIDPLSFLYFLAQRNTTHQFEPVFQSVHEVFDIRPDIEFPLKRPEIPTPNPQAPVLFHYKGESLQPELLWRLFRQAAKETPAIKGDDFNAALEIKGVGMSKLTQTLFIVNPCYFLPAFEYRHRFPDYHYLPTELQKKST